MNEHLINHPPNLNDTHLTATLSPLTLCKSNLSLPWTTLWITPLIRRSARE